MSNKKGEDVVIAKVGDKSLYLSEIAGVAASGQNPQDSIRILKGLADNWVRDQLMILEAEKNLPSDLDLKKLVENYRSSLLLYNFETKIVAEYLDTIISDQEKQSYYALKKDEFVLSEPVVKFEFVKIRSNAKDVKKFKENWKKGRSDEYEAIATSQSDYFDLSGDKWKSLAELTQLMPENLFKEKTLSDKGRHDNSNNGFEYFVNIKDFIDKNKIPPFEFIESKIGKVILNQRKKDLLQKKKQQIFEKEGSKAKVFIK